MAKDVRLQKMLADCGVASRRKAEEMIANGRVKVNGRVAKIGDKVDTKKDKITVDAAPGAVDKYIHMGMKPTAPEQMVDGKRYTPMERLV